MASKPRKRSTARRTSRRRQKTRLIPAWLWLLMGIALGVVVAYSGQLRQLFNDRDIEVQTRINTPVTIPTPATRVEPRQPEAPKVVTIIPPKEAPKYDFYYRLPKEEVIVKEDEYKAVTKPPVVFQAPANTVKSSDGVRYLIQAGSFRTHKDADRRKAQLALMGMQAAIEKVKTDSGQWFRVKLGPYGNLDQANQVRTELHSNKIKTLLVNAPGQ